MIEIYKDELSKINGKDCPNCIFFAKMLDEATGQVGSCNNTEVKNQKGEVAVGTSHHCIKFNKK